ncbi:hypothetical protein LZ189_27940, partial [Rhodovulum sulfidophilum]|nr:hypothetical protein [Rhodovulum sulfidophilum]
IYGSVASGQREEEASHPQTGHYQPRHAQTRPPEKAGFPVSSGGCSRCSGPGPGAPDIARHRRSP